MRFTVTGAAVNYSAQGTLSSSGDGSQAAAFFLYRTSGANPTVHSIQNQNVAVSGTLPPGTYEMSTGASSGNVFGTTPASGTASYSITFDIDP